MIAIALRAELAAGDAALVESHLRGKLRGSGTGKVDVPAQSAEAAEQVTSKESAAKDAVRKTATASRAARSAGGATAVAEAPPVDGKPAANGLAKEIPTVENKGVSADFTTVTWNLVSGLKWSDGTAVTAVKRA